MLIIIKIPDLTFLHSFLSLSSCYSHLQVGVEEALLRALCSFRGRNIFLFDIIQALLSKQTQLPPDCNIIMIKLRFEIFYIALKSSSKFSNQSIPRCCEILMRLFYGFILCIDSGSSMFKSLQFNQSSCSGEN